MSRRILTMPHVELNQVWRVFKGPPRFFRIVELVRELGRQQAKVTTCEADGSEIRGRRPYTVTLRSFARGRYVLWKDAP